MNLFISAREYFVEVVQEGIRRRRLETIPRVEHYLVCLLEHYLDARNLFEPEYDEMGQRRPTTLAEMYLLAGQSERPRRMDLLKGLGDRSLYLSGFFGDSFARKLVDVDYYVNMGGLAYTHLANETDDETLAQVYRIFGHQFIDYVDVLTHISQKASTHSNENLLRLYECYLKTGSELARETLNDRGVATPSPETVKKSRQF